MAGEYQAFKDALNSVFNLGSGPTVQSTLAASTMNVQSLTAATEVLIVTGAGQLNGVCLVATGTAAVNFGYQDASATATGSARFFQIRNVVAGVWPVTFDRPASFAKGLVLSYTASGAVTLDVNTAFNTYPLGDPRPWAPGLR